MPTQPVTSEGRAVRRERALIVVDMVPSVVYGRASKTVSAGVGPGIVRSAEACIPYIQGELRYFRERDRCVVFAVSTADDEEPEAMVPDLTPRKGEIVLRKPAFSAFFGTDLAKTLRARGAGRVTLAGAGCADNILLTAADAYAHGFGVSVPDPCVADVDPNDRAYALHLIRERWGDEGDDDVTQPLSTNPLAADKGADLGAHEHGAGGLPSGES